MKMPAFVHDHPFDPSYGYDFEALQSVGCPDEPQDYQEFWKNLYQTSMGIDLRLAVNRRQDLDKDDIEVYEALYDSWEGLRVGAFLTRRAGSTPKRGVVIGHGYGGREQPEYEIPVPYDGWAAFPCARGFGLSGHEHLPAEAHTHVVHGIERKETYLHLGSVVDYWLAVSVLQDVMEDESAGIDYVGGSFGGGIGAMMLAWEKRVSRGCLVVPSFGNHPLRLSLQCAGSGESVRQYAQLHPEVTGVLSYFDAAIAAKYITIPMLIVNALFDPAVPPPGQFAVYNAISSSKQLHVIPAGHFDGYPAQSTHDHEAFLAQRRFFTLEET